MRKKNYYFNKFFNKRSFCSDPAGALFVFILYLSFFYLPATQNFIQLAPKWAPLKYVVETDSQPVGVTSTLGNTMYVADLKAWKNLSPQDKEATLIHERIHSIREHELGLILFLIKYNSSNEFKLNEEKIAYYHEMIHKMSKNIEIDVDEEASRISNQSVYGGIISKASATAWVKAVLAKQWVAPR